MVQLVVLQLKRRMYICDFISIISNSSTDCSTTEAEIIYLRTSVHCEENFLNIFGNKVFTNF